MVSTAHINNDFGFTVLGSGSGGNSTVIHSKHGCFLLDAGFSAKELEKRLNSVGVSPASIQAILITHEHEDHVRGCRVFADRYGIGAYLTSETCRAMANTKFLPEKRMLITPGCAFELSGTTVEPFSIPHDVADAVAYTFRCDGCKIGYATDLGCVSNLTMTKLRDCDAIVLESNYDPESLRNCARPLHTKRRIMGKHGHLSNSDAMETLRQLLSVKTRFVTLAHLSRECNTPDLVRELAQTMLTDENRTDVSLSIASQNEPLETCWLNRQENL